jgi:hypothetical protein
MVMQEHAFDAHHLRVQLDQHDIPGRPLVQKCK